MFLLHFFNAMSGNIPYIGSKISLITTSDIRYEGILFTLNREESTIAVQNVRSFGTEGRRSPEVPMSNEIYDFIIFRGKDLKDLTVLQGAPERASATAATAATSSATSPMGGAYGSQETYLDSHSHMQSAVQSPYDSSGMYSHQSQMGSQLTSPASNDTGYGQRGSHGSTGAMGSSAGVSGYQRQHASSVNGFASSASGCSGGYLSSSASRPPTSAPPEKSSYGQAPSAHRQPYGEGPQGHLQYMPDRGAASGHYEEGNGLGSPVAGPRPTGASSSVQGAGASDAKDRGMGPSAYGMSGSIDGKGAAGLASAAKGGGRGKGGAQKKPLFEVLRVHKRAEELIVKQMRGQSSASVEPQILRAMSEQNLAVYHFYLDFVNYCQTTHGLSDEQQWDALSKALKKHFEKDFGSGPASQSQKPPQPQRPNNTLGDFITIETSKSGKKSAKAQPSAQAPSSTKVTARGGGSGGGRTGRGVGRGDKKDLDGQYAELDGPSDFGDSSSGSTWVCPRCTLRNENILLECAACGTPKQAAALWAEFPPLGS